MGEKDRCNRPGYRNLAQSCRTRKRRRVVRRCRIKRDNLAMGRVLALSCFWALDAAPCFTVSCCPWLKL